MVQCRDSGLFSGTVRVLNGSNKNTTSARSSQTSDPPRGCSQQRHREETALACLADMQALAEARTDRAADARGRNPRGRKIDWYHSRSVPEIRPNISGTCSEADAVYDDELMGDFKKFANALEECKKVLWKEVEPPLSKLAVAIERHPVLFSVGAVAFIAAMWLGR